MNDQVILRATKRNGGLEVTTAGTGNDQLAAIRVAAAATFRVLTAARRCRKKWPQARSQAPSWMGSRRPGKATAE